MTRASFQTGSKQAIHKRCGGCPEPRLVAEMSFGFWTSLLDSRYETLWHKIIGDVFPHMPRTIRTRGEASRRMNAVRKLRNAAFHHHSIWHWKDLKQQHEEIQTLTGWVCESIAVISKRVDRFPAVFSAGSDGVSHFIDKISN